MLDCLVSRARVRTVHGDGRLVVEVANGQACEGCRCGRLTSLAGHLPIALDLERTEPAREGEEVLLSMPAREVLRGAAWLHGLPWAATVAGAGLGAVAGLGDLGCLAGSLLGLGAALWILRVSRPRWGGRAVRSLRIVPRA